MSHIQVPADSTGKKVDTAQLTDGVDTVERQLVVLAGGSGTAEVVVVTNAAPGANDMGVVVRQAGPISAVGTVAISNTLDMNAVAISGTATIAGRVVISATATVAGSVVISGTATVAGVVGLTAGTANIGNLDFISRTVQVAIATPYILQGISTTVIVAVSTPFTIQAISTTVTVAGNVNLSTVPNLNISTMPAVNISATAPVAVKSMYVNTAPISASRGPKTVIASTSSNVTLATGPGAGMAIYVTGVMATNAAGTNTLGRFGTSGSAGTVQGYMAQSGGGFTMKFDPPWELSAAEALVCSVKPNASEGIFVAHFFVASADAL